MDAIRVMLLEWDPDLACLLRDFLRSSGFQVFEPASGEQARRLLQDAAVDVVLAEAKCLESMGLSLESLGLPILELEEMGGSEHGPAEELGPSGRVLSKPVKLSVIRDTLQEMTSLPAGSGGGLRAQGP